MAQRPIYVFDSTLGQWVGLGQANPVTYQPNAPTSPSSGDIWVDSNASTALLNSNDYLLKSEALSSYVTPIGIISPYAGSVAPAKWLMCDGSGFSSSTYADLATLLGDVYATHSGTTYYVPDLRGRTVIGMGAGSLLTNRTIGNSFGAETLPSHDHYFYHDHGSVTATSGNDSPDHSHDWSFTDRSGGVGDSASGWDTSAETVDTTRTITTGGRSAFHQHTTVVDLPASAGYTATTGTGNHGVMQPSIVLNYIIRALP